MSNVKSVFWVWVRLVTIIAGSLSSAFLRSGEVAQYDGRSLELLGLTFICGFTGVVLVIGLQTLNSRADRVWIRPSWRVNPFSVFQPIQFFHFMAFYCIGMSAMALAMSFLKNGLLALALLIGSFSVGLLVGIQCCLVLFRRKFSYRQLERAVND